MEKRGSVLFSGLLLLAMATLFTVCSKDEEEPPKPSDVWDIDKDGIPKFVATDFIELDKIGRISKFRSSYGHDYSDAFEHCRSMKHYYEPLAGTDWASVKVFAPVTGTITRWEQEWAGVKVEIAADDYPAFRFSIFHVNMAVQRSVGDKVTAGEQLGTHIGTQTMSDIAVIVNDATRQGRMVSYFDVMTDALFRSYVNRGAASRDVLIIPQADRDANPLECSGDTFVSADVLDAWFVLN